MSMQNQRDPDTILFDSELDKIRVAVLDSKRQLLHIDEQSEASKWLTGQIYSAKITSIKPQIGAVFAEFQVQNAKDQKQKHGFLAADNISPDYHLKPWSEENGEPDLNQLLKVGQKLLVQVKKDQQGHESKGAALTTYISLAGSYLVFLPNSNKQAVSRKADPVQKAKAKEIIESLNIPEEHGIILRTAGIDKSLEELQQDYTALLNQWNIIKEQWMKAPVPSLLHEEENIIVRTLRDRFNSSTQKIVTNHLNISAFVKDTLAIRRPSTPTENLFESYDHAQPLFEHYGVEEQIEELFKTSHNLPSGGHLIIQGTEAGVMIDVNSSRSTVGNNIEETALNTNLEAALKAADLLRLRDMGGIIYIDFIDMKLPENRTKVEQTFISATSCDKAKIKYEPISELSGCMVVLRQSMGYPFFKSSLEPLINDQSIVVGKKRSVASYATHVMHLILKNAQYDTDVLQLQLPVDVATFILNEGRKKIDEIEKRYQTDIIIIPNETFKELKCTVKRFRREDGGAESALSYQEMSRTEIEKPWRAVSNQARTSMLNQTQDSKQDTSSNAKQDTGLLDSIWEAIFGKSEPKADEASALQNNRNQFKKHSRRHTGNRTRRHDGQRPNSNNRRREYGNKSQEYQAFQSVSQEKHTSPMADSHTAPIQTEQRQPESSVISDIEQNSSQRNGSRNRTRRSRRNVRKPFNTSNQDGSFNNDSDLIKHLDED